MVINDNRAEIQLRIEECQCLDCKFIRRIPIPRNRSEYRAVPKALRDAIENHYFLHRIAENIENGDEFEFNEEIEDDE